MHKSLDEFEFRPGPTTDYGNLQVMKTGIISWMSSNFGKTKSLRFLGCF